jgi:hypothetical protein
VGILWWWLRDDFNDFSRNDDIVCSLALLFGFALWLCSLALLFGFALGVPAFIFAFYSEHILASLPKHHVGSRRYVVVDHKVITTNGLPLLHYLYRIFSRYHPADQVLPVDIR